MTSLKEKLPLRFQSKRNRVLAGQVREKLHYASSSSLPQKKQKPSGLLVVGCRSDMKQREREFAEVQAYNEDIAESITNTLGRAAISQEELQKIEEETVQGFDSTWHLFRTTLERAHTDPSCPYYQNESPLCTPSGTPTITPRFSKSSSESDSANGEKNTCNFECTCFPLEQFSSHEVLSLAGWECCKVPPQLTRLAHQLRATDLSCNWLLNISSYFSHMTRLEKLVLTGNLFKEIPEVLFSLHNLSEVDLSFNRISLLPRNIAQHWPKLVSLNLSYNRITSTIPPPTKSSIGSIIASISRGKPKLRTDTGPSQESNANSVRYPLMFPPTLISLRLGNNLLDELPWEWFLPEKPDFPEYEPGYESEHVMLSDPPPVKSELLHLHLDNNLLYEVPRWLPYACPSLRTLNMKRNRLGYLRAKLKYLDENPNAELSETPKEKQMDMTEFMAPEYPRKFWIPFLTMFDLQQLLMGWNWVDDEMLKASQDLGIWSCVSNLRILDFGNNRIEKIPIDLFKSVVPPNSRESGSLKERSLLSRTKSDSIINMEMEMEMNQPGCSRRQSATVTLSGSSRKDVDTYSAMDSTEYEMDTDDDEEDLSLSEDAVVQVLGGSSKDEDEHSKKAESKQERDALVEQFQNLLGFNEYSVTALPYLQELNLSGNRKLERIPSNVLKRLTRLQYLNLSNTILQKVPKALSRLTRLREFFVHRYEDLPNPFDNLIKKGDTFTEIFPTFRGPSFLQETKESLHNLQISSEVMINIICSEPGAISLTQCDKQTLSQFSEIIPGLFLSSEFGARREFNLRTLGITHILAVSSSPSAHFPEDYSYLMIEESDNSEVNLRKYFAMTNAFIDAGRRNGNRCLVHCAAGVSRSTTLIAAYLMYISGISPAKAVQVVRECRPIANPNFGFVQQLFAYSNRLNKSKRYRRHQQYRVSQTYAKAPGVCKYELLTV